MKDPPVVEDAEAVGKVENDVDIVAPTVIVTSVDITPKEEGKVKSEPMSPDPWRSPPRKRRKPDLEFPAVSSPALPAVSSPAISAVSSPAFPESPAAKSGDTPVKADGPDSKYALGSKLEARDLSTGKWYNVKVVEVDYDDREVLIHFEKWSQRFDEWIPMDSSRLREIQRKTHGKTSECGYRVGETVMAIWTDCRKYPAKVKAILSADKVEVLFFDGFSKAMKINKISKFGGDLEIQPEKPPFGAATMTKAERRERNRKIESVADLFHMKRFRKPKEERKSNDTCTVFTSPEPQKAVEPVVDAKPPEREVSMSDNEGEKMYINLDASFSKDESPADTPPKKPVVKRPKPQQPEGKRRKRTYNRVFLDSSPAGTLREVHPGRARNPEGGPSDDLDNWEPDGDEAYVVESSDGLRRSIIVADDRLPRGWEKHTIQRRSGNSAGKWDVFLVSPTGRRFRSRKEMSSYFAETKEVYEPHLYDFTLRGLSHRASCTMRRKRRGTQYVRPVAAYAKRRHQKGRAKPPHTLPSSESDGAKPEGLETPQRKTAAKSGGKQGGRASTGKAPAKPSGSGTVFETPTQVKLEAEKLPPPDEGKVYVGQMQVEMDLDGGFVCPKEGCLKHFRKENLLQMHIKHYHPEYNKFMGSTPNVADLAYARTVGEPIEDIVPCGRALDSAFFESINRFEATRKPAPPPPAPPTQRKEEAGPVAVPIEGKKVLRVQTPGNSVLTDHVKVKEEPTPAEPAKPVSSPLRDLLREHPKPGVTAGIKTLLPVSRPSTSKTTMDPTVEWRSGSSGVAAKPKMRKRRLSDAYMESLKRKKLAKRAAESSSSEVSSSDTFLTPTHIRPHKKLPLLAASLARPPLLPEQFNSSELTATRAPEMTQEQLNKRDIINCTCGVMEEDGLMIQCDLCLCWQHGYCNAIESERQVPDKYVCAICLRPARARRSLRHRHDQTWLKEGALPSAAKLRGTGTTESAPRTSLLRQSHALTGALLGVNTALRSLRAKVNVADASDHPKLYLWAKPWSKTALNVTDEAETKSDAEVKTEVFEAEEKKAEEEKPNTDAIGGSKILLQALTSGATSSSAPLDDKQLFDLPISQSELLHFASSMADNLDRTPAPEPEKPIDPGECRSLLLDHIEHDQRQLMRSLDQIARHITALEAADPEPPPQESVEFCPRTKHTIQMLLRDLSTVRNIAAL